MVTAGVGAGPAGGQGAAKYSTAHMATSPRQSHLAPPGSDETEKPGTREACVAPEDSTHVGRRPLTPGRSCTHRAPTRPFSWVSTWGPACRVVSPAQTCRRSGPPCHRCPLGPCEAVRTGRSGSAGHVRRSHSRLLAPREASQSRAHIPKPLCHRLDPVPQRRWVLGSDPYQQHLCGFRGRSVSASDASASTTCFRQVMRVDGSRPPPKTALGDGRTSVQAAAHLQCRHRPLTFHLAQLT